MTKVVVTAAVIQRDGRYLVTRRQKGIHLEGYWEFPGGKCEPGEDLTAAMTRELREELAVDAVVGAEVMATAHDYADRRVVLHFLECRITGQPVPQQGQEMQWVTPGEMAQLRFPPADEALIERLTARTAEP
jgi:8-oxo-dGTP diphosphatase